MIMEIQASAALTPPPLQERAACVCGQAAGSRQRLAERRIVSCVGNHTAPIEP
jgi:hypothetical protein